MAARESHVNMAWVVRACVHGAGLGCFG